VSTAVVPAPVPLRGADERPAIGRLMVVELRKMVDTRAGAWLLISTALLTVAAVVIAGLAFKAADRDLRSFIGLASAPMSIIGPVVGILLVTSEWSQRTSLITFTLVPQRSRVMVAKLIACVVLGLLGYVICLGTGVLATAAFGGGTSDTWSFSAALVVQNGVSVLVSMIAGFAFGAALLASAPAIVLFYALPTAWGALGSIHALEGAAKWLDQSRTMRHISEHPFSTGEWARVGTSIALWVLLPLVIGWWRVKRNDVR
jgi:hypothetical protein